MNNSSLLSTFTKYLKTDSENIISRFLNRINKLLYILLITMFSALIYWKFINPTFDIFLFIKFAVLTSSTITFVFILHIFHGYRTKLEYELTNEQNHSSDLIKEIGVLKRRLEEKQEQLSFYHKRFQTFMNYYRIYIQHTNELISIHDIYGRFSYVSPTVKNILGYSQGQLIGKNLTQVCHPDDLPLLDKTFSFNGVKSKSSKIRFQCEYGKYKWFIIYTDLYRNPRLKRQVLSTIREIPFRESIKFTYRDGDMDDKINMQ
ncbi:MAG TPA: PAS domain S-box protein [Balneolales bacterium]|nr:PAS domain S-box protein [Balneolales bacterium]